jgi:autophagy-related protein 2
MDSYQDSPSHRLQSILEVSVSKLFVAETVSHAQRPVKMLGDWIDDSDHPRDTRCGSWMLKMATWTPITRISSSNEINSDDCEVTMQLLPMRCILDQRAISFARAFFNKQIDDDDSDDDVKDSVTKSSWSDALHVMPPPRFCLFKVKPWKVKVDYLPQKIDINALREGSVVELVNIAPIHRMVITLSEVNVVDSDGGGPAFSQIVSSWVREICATQLHKFLANAQPFEPITDVGQGLSDLVVLPYEAFKNGESVQRAMTKGFANFAEVVAFQTLTTASGLTKGAADIMSEALKHSLALNALPRGSNAVDSLAAGFQAAKIVLINQDYNRKGVTGAMSSLVYGIPVLLVGPLTGVSDAAAYTFLGARNVIRPDIMKDEDATTILD